MYNKKLKITFSMVIFVIVIIFTSPFLMNNYFQNKTKVNSHQYSEYFIDTYEESRESFLSKAEILNNSWDDVIVTSFPVDESDNLFIDSIELPSMSQKENLIVITTGVHGIEGYIGATMLEVFIDKFLPNLDKNNTGILMISNVNPYGMKYKRRYNENNVDLNRNFIFNWDELDLNTNKDYPIVESFLEPQKPIGNAALHEIGFYIGIGNQVIQNGVDTLSNALLGGQYTNPKGVYYGGNSDEISTSYIKNLFNSTLKKGYKNIVHLDLHSGFGPRYDMSIFNSAYDKTSYAKASEAFGYSQIIAIDSEEFYPTSGDITEYYYKLNESMGNPVTLYSTCFEFGTLGNSLLKSITSMKYTIDENRNNFFPTSSKNTNSIIHSRYMEMFYPAETQWRIKAVEDFIKATSGVLDNKLSK